MSSELFIITGIPGSGKTVLCSVLFLRYGKRFFPKNSAAQDFVDNAEVLNLQQWPPETNPFASHKAMQWEYKHNGKKCRLIVLDKAGESWRNFVRENQEPDSKMSVAAKQKLQNLRIQLSVNDANELETIERQFQKAACVCILLDLADDINHGKNNEQKNFVEAIINYLEKTGRNKCPIALVITKETMYGPKENWKPIVQKYESIFSRHWTGKVKTIYTDAVADTVLNEANKLIPASDFSSHGLDDLLNWVSQETDHSRKIKLRIFIFWGIILLVAILGSLIFLPIWISILIVLVIGSYFIYRFFL